MADRDDELAFADTELPDRLPQPLFISADQMVLACERWQLLDDGRDRSSLEDRFEAALALDPDAPEFEAEVQDLLDIGLTLPMRTHYRCVEPSD